MNKKVSKTHETKSAANKQKKTVHPSKGVEI